ncbi:hypothetical protein MOB41_16855 [Bacillus haynesii]|uniref:hypothetical protein n=1 Tax=Bacillus haynesii TaxID=1925021 RepID=UPI00227E12C0|nr:hypothetical protein [Bacillus haynesii]MCY7780071.1 hypothetical protein [Bacillus haynesii]MEC0669651.1 hypothetical protein [Bacillus haynesii]
MAESKRESIGKIKIDLDVSDAITGLKAVQREAKAATKALAELESDRTRKDCLNDEQVDDLVGEYIKSSSSWIQDFLNKNGIRICEVEDGIRWVRKRGVFPS